MVNHISNKFDVKLDLRLQLLEPERYPFLFKSLYGLLMILPQSTAFETLRNRLTCISSLGVLQLIPKRYIIIIIAFNRVLKLVFDS
jgi:hypothetical protein